MMRFLSLLLILFLCGPAQAEDQILFEAKHPADIISGLDYTRLVAQAQRRDPNTNFNYLRNLYPRMLFYQPETKILSQELFDLAENVLRTKGSDAHRDALRAYNDFVALHIAHPDIMWGAHILADSDTALGDPGFYRWVYAALRESLISSGDGKTPETAYYTFTFGEEAILFSTLELQRLKTETVKESDRTYHMHMVYNVKEDRFFTLFTNVSQATRTRDENTRIDLFND